MGKDSSPAPPLDSVNHQVMTIFSSQGSPPAFYPPDGRYTVSAHVTVRKRFVFCLGGPAPPRAGGQEGPLTER